MNNPKHILFLNKVDSDALTTTSFIVSSEPLIQTTTLPFDSSTWNKKIPWVFTSRTASALFQQSDLPERVYAIGKRTAHHIKNALLPSSSTAKALAEFIIENGEQSVLFICGEQRRNDLPKRLNEAQIKVTEEVVYHTQILQKNVDLQSVDALAFMSPSSVVGMAQNGGFNELPCFAIGATTAQTLIEHGQTPIISKESSAESIVQTAQSYFNR